MRLILLFIALTFATNAYSEAYTWQGTVFNSFKPKIDEPQGCILGTIGRNKDPAYDKQYRGVGLMFQETRNFGTEKEQSIARYIYNRPTAKLNDFNDTNSFGKYFKLCLKPGNYFLRGFEINSGTYNFYNQDAFSIPFTVEQGKNIYVGNFSLSLGNPKRNCAKSVPTLVRDSVPILLRDESERDIPLIMKSKDRPSSPPEVQILSPDFENGIITSCGSEA